MNMGKEFGVLIGYKKDKFEPLNNIVYDYSKLLDDKLNSNLN